MLLHYEYTNPMSFHSESTSVNPFKTQFGNLPSRKEERKLQWNGFYSKEALSLEPSTQKNENIYLKNVDERLVNKNEGSTIFN